METVSPAKALTSRPLIPYNREMVSSIRLPATGGSFHLTAMLSGLGAGFSRGLVFCMGLILILCAGLIACFAVLSAQMRQPPPAAAIPRAKTADEIFNARYYPLIDCPLFRLPRKRLFSYHYPNTVTHLPEPLPEILPTLEPSPKVPLYPRVITVAPAADAQGADGVR